jgi:hypothetical protein
MNTREGNSQSQLFTLRIRPEALGQGRTEWRGKVQHVASGEARYFRDWPALITFLEETLSELPENSQGKEGSEP